MHWRADALEGWWLVAGGWWLVAGGPFLRLCESVLGEGVPTRPTPHHRSAESRTVFILK